MIIGGTILALSFRRLDTETRERFTPGINFKALTEAWRKEGVGGVKPIRHYCICEWSLSWEGDVTAIIKGIQKSIKHETVISVKFFCLAALLERISLPIF